MKNKTLLTLFNLALGMSAAQVARAQNTAFTYQGKFNDGCCAATGYYDFTFKVFNSVGPGSTGQQGPTVPLTRVPVTNGLFTVSLDFGSTPFTGARRWLQIEARTNNLAASFVTLLPRTELTPTPYAIYAQTAGTVTNGSIQANQLRTVGTPSAGQVLRYNGTSLEWQTPGGGAWAGSGNNVFYNAGNVGIGTTSFGSLLTVGSSSTRGTLNVVGSASVIPAMSLTDSRGSGYQYSIYGGLNGTGTLDIFDQNAAATRLTIDSSGNVGIGTTSPAAKLHIDPNGSGSIHLGGSEPGRTWMSLAVTDATGGAGKIQCVKSEGSLWGDLYLNPSGGNVGIGTTTPSKKLELHGFGDVEIGLQSDDPGGRLWAIQSSGVAGFRDATFQIIDRTAGVARMIIDPNDGTVSVGVLQINGADVAEPFEMSTKDLPKGSVVTIDEEHPGQLKVSDHAYDTQVAGILSGANGVRSGIRLKQEGFNDRGQEVALSGRVYALADASGASIKPGDLLTTSDIPGHCMKVTDSARAQGAIIGKAMSALKEGKGMVLVLVSLQ